MAGRSRDMGLGTTWCSNSATRRFLHITQAQTATDHSEDHVHVYVYTPHYQIDNNTYVGVGIDVVLSMMHKCGAVDSTVVLIMQLTSLLRAQVRQVVQLYALLPTKCSRQYHANSEAASSTAKNADYLLMVRLTS